MSYLSFDKYHSERKPQLYFLFRLCIADPSYSVVKQQKDVTSDIATSRFLSNQYRRYMFAKQMPLVCEHNSKHGGKDWLVTRATCCCARRNVNLKCLLLWNMVRCG